MTTTDPPFPPPGGTTWSTSATLRRASERLAGRPPSLLARPLHLPVRVQLDPTLGTLLAVVAGAAAMDAVGHVGIDGIAGLVLAVVLAVTAVRSAPCPSAATILGGVLLIAVGAGTALRTHPMVLAADWLVLLAALPIVGTLASGRSARDLSPVHAFFAEFRWLGYLFRRAS